LEKATAQLTEALKDPQLSSGLAWLQTLIRKGYPFREEPAPYSPPEDGGLVSVLAETETHAVVVNSIKEGGKRFAGDLANMLDQIRTAGQDAYILWW